MRIYKEDNVIQGKTTRVSDEKGVKQLQGNEISFGKKFVRKDRFVEEEDTIYEIDGECEKCLEKKGM